MCTSGACGRRPAILLTACLLLVRCSFVAGFLTQLPDLHIHVSLNGSDTNDGSNKHPVQTLGKALSICYNTSHTGRGLTIEMHAGRHFLRSGLTIRQHVGKHLTLRGTHNGNDEVHLTGGQRIPSNSFKPVTDQHILTRLKPSARNHVKVVHLPDLGITNYGNLSKYGMWSIRHPLMEIFYNGSPLKETAYPKDGYLNIAGTPDGLNGTRFKFNGTLPTSWAAERQLWTFGFWRYTWQDLAIKVSSLDQTHNIVRLDKAPPSGIWKDGSYGKRDPPSFSGNAGYFKFTNILAELDEPGEYYLDRAAGNMYIWSPNSDGSVHPTDYVEVSMTSRCIRLADHLKQFTMQYLTIEACREVGVYGRSLSHVDISRVEVRNTGNKGIAFYDDNRNVRIMNSMIHDTVGGIYLSGGDRKNLTISGNLVRNCEITRFSRIGISGTTGVGIYGVGATVEHNDIYDGNYNAIFYAGNNHNIRYNEIHHVCLRDADCGAITADGDWTAFGNKVLGNDVHHILRLVPGAIVKAILLNDQSSGSTLYSNVLHDNEVHVVIEGGRNNNIIQNLMYNATLYSMYVDGRGIYHNNDHFLIRKLHNVPYNSSSWTSQYSSLKGFDTKNASLPEGNRIIRNVVYNKDPHTEFIHGLTGWVNANRYYSVTGTLYSVGPGDHVDVSHGDYRMKCHAKEWAGHHKVPQFPSPNAAGITDTYGPKNHQKAPVKITLQSSACPTLAPETHVPMHAYLPDGSYSNQMINVSNTGCWLKVTKCTDNPGGVGTYRDMHGERFDHAAETEADCFRQAVFEWKYCGAHPGEPVAAIFGKSGAMTYAGDGCYSASYGCPLHGGPADGHVVPGRIGRDVYAEQHYGAATNETQCLKQALNRWKYCGSNKNHPVTYIYRPTGAMRTAGAGCWIHMDKCPLHQSLKLMFYDATGATNAHTDDNEQNCLQRAEYYWRYCGDDLQYPVTAQFRPHASSYTFPAS